MVEGQVHVENAAGQTRGLFPDGLHSWNILQIFPGRGRLGHTTVDVVNLFSSKIRSRLSYTQL